MKITGDSTDQTLDGTIDADVIKGLGGADILNGLGGNDRLEGGKGDDTLNGGTGDNTFIGGLGDDTYVLTGRYENIVVGLGQDTVDLSDFSMGDGYLGIAAGNSAKGVFALIDGDEDFGVIRIDNGSDPEGLVMFEDLNNALQLDFSKPEGGMGIDGTAFADTFLIDAGEQGWIQIRPGEGADTIKIEGDSGTVRLDYSDQTDGIFANLKFGFVIDGGDGFVVDQIEGSGRVRELRGTDHDDTMYGSKFDDRFILRQGDDFVAGGRGSDTVRYDRSGVDRVVVDLGKETATGTWNGEAFSDTLRSIENVRGSRNDNDKLTGSKADNTLEGRGGNDVLTGKRGNDNLVGGEGDDRFVFRDGDRFDYIRDFEADNNKEKIHLRAVTEITSSSDLITNHMTDTIDANRTVSYINDGADLVITLEGIRIADLDSGDFIF